MNTPELYDTGMIPNERIASYAWAKLNCGPDQKIIFDSDRRALLVKKEKIDYLMDKLFGR